MRKLPALASLFFLCAAARADIVYLDNGGTLEGKVVRKNGKVYIEQPNGVVIVDEERVDHIEKKATDLEVFQARNDALDPKTPGAAERLVELGRWCADRRLAAQARQSYQRALEADSEQPVARAALGYTKYEGVWLTSDEINARRGLLRHGDAWVTPEAKGDLAKLEAQTELEKARAVVERLKLERTEAEVRRAEAEADAARTRDAYRDYTYPVVYSGAYYGSSRHTPVRADAPLVLGPGDRVFYSTRSPLGAPVIRADGTTAIQQIVIPGSGLRVPITSTVDAPPPCARR